jgi:hypothetical protein
MEGYFPSIFFKYFFLYLLLFLYFSVSFCAGKEVASQNFSATRFGLSIKVKVCKGLRSNGEQYEQNSSR